MTTPGDGMLSIVVAMEPGAPLHSASPDPFLDPVPFVSVVLAVLNEASAIEAAIDSIIGQSYPADRLEVLVVDGGSTDDTRRLVTARARAHPSIRLLDNPDREMPHGLNVGINAARGELIAVASGHSVLPHDYLVNAVGSLRDTRAWAVGGRIRRRASTPTQSAIAWATASPFGIGNARHNFSDAAGEVEAVFPGVWPRWVFDRVGLFDPAMTRNEDNEFSLRIRNKGGRIWLDPRIEVEYVPRASLAQLFDQFRRYGFGKVRVARKHRGAIPARALVPAVWVAFVLTSAPIAALWPSWRRVAPAGMLAYAAFVTVGAVASGRAGNSASRTAVTLMTLHAAYGLGVWQGLAEWALRQHPMTSWTR
jgi:GT2 family glycosyltransferase